MKTIVLTGGGTAGHIMPLVSLFPHIKRDFDKICYVGSGKEIERKLVSPLNIPIFNIDPPKFIRKPTFKNLLIPFKMKKAVEKAKEILIKVNADCIFSKGGYCALPVCIAGKQLGIPVICHESDLSIGLANKITKRFAKYLCTTFEETAVRYNGIYTGPPINEDIASVDKINAKAYFHIESKKPVLLITGGSQGSEIINKAVYKNIDELTKHFFVIHLYGKNNKCPYRSNIDYLPLAFANMAYCISACDIALSRGGSNTLFELLYCLVPSLIIPLEKGSRGDQVKNATYFKDKNVIMLEREENLEKNILSLSLDLYKNRFELKKEMKKLGIQSGNEKIRKCILEAIKTKLSTK